MTKTYNDIEAVTHLLEEKERDLELAARIGQTLLSKNKEVSSRAETLEEQLSAANDKVNQLRHDLALKDELLRIFHEDLEHEPGAKSLENQGKSHEDVDFLEKKIKNLEDENLTLKLEGAQLRSDTTSYEEKEKKLVEDCISQIGDLNRQVETLAEELHLKSRESIQHKDEVTVYLSQVTDLQRKIRLLTAENMDMHERLTHSIDSQRSLTKELTAMQDRYDELFELLEEAQEDVRLLRERQKSGKGPPVRNHPDESLESYNSLASELEASLQKQTDLTEEMQQLEQSHEFLSNITNTITGNEDKCTAKRDKSWKIFETTRAAKRAAEVKAMENERKSSVRMSVAESPCLLQRRDSDAASQPDNLSTSSEAPSQVSSQVSSAQLSNTGPYDLSLDSEHSDIDFFYSNPELGRPGIPGSNDLESALRRLAIRRANELNERDFLEEQRRKYLHMYKNEQASSLSSTYNTPSNASTTSNSSKSGFRKSEKLQIVKPLEGSETLIRWQQLASPNLSGIFEPKDGVQMKSEKPGRSKPDNDFEEDELQDIHTRKQHDSGMIYTFTDSTIGHMGSNMPFLQPSQRSSPNPNETPMHCSTPKASHRGEFERDTANDKSEVPFDSENPASFGLASVLNNNESVLLRTAPTLRSSNKSSIHEKDIDKSLLHNRHEHLLPMPSNNASSSILKSRNLPGSRSLQEMMQNSEEKVGVEHGVLETTPKRKELLQPGMTGQGLIQQLKNKGYSLYGLWGSGNKKEVDNSDTKASDVDSLPREGSTSGRGLGVLGAISKCGRNKDL